jgi:preprotein translocase subunit SecA
MPKEGDDDPKSGGLALFRAYRGLPKYGPLIKFLSEPGIRVLQKAENYYLADQQRKMHRPMKSRCCFTIDEKNNLST